MRRARGFEVPGRAGEGTGPTARPTASAPIVLMPRCLDTHSVIRGDAGGFQMTG